MSALFPRRACIAAVLLVGACRADNTTDERAPSGDDGQVATVAMPATAACGNAGLPDCPLQRWMKATLQTYQRSGDQQRLARSFRDLAAHAPEGYGDWKALSERGAELADKNDAAAIKQICKDCHGTHRARYRRELRNHPVW